ncbi:helix-turn-helix domain-containing protein [Sphingomonas sp. CCH15-F11]|uniref:helix-turn-helix domain-containing protein n=1 Tax=Sphingomonas sp. CCH15-F11 TaxID=1768785 RepID=UPI0008336E83|nr:helix-turn-helix domain-containing protein [Sphingomonas sp. CCH15-F11]
MSNLVVPRREIGGDALHRTERQVLDLWDQGVGFRGIAAKLGISVQTVRSIVARLDGGGDTEKRFREATIRSTAQLLAAINALRAKRS